MLGALLVGLVAACGGGPPSEAEIAAALGASDGASKIYEIENLSRKDYKRDDRGRYSCDISYEVVFQGNLRCPEEVKAKIEVSITGSGSITVTVTSVLTRPAA